MARLKYSFEQLLCKSSELQKKYKKGHIYSLFEMYKSFFRQSNSSRTDLLHQKKRACSELIFGDCACHSPQAKANLSTAATVE